MIEKSKSCFKRTDMNNKYQSKTSTERSNQYLDYLIDPSFQRVNRLFVLSFEDNAHSKGYNQYFLPTIETKDYNVMIDDKTFFISQIKTIQKHMIVFKKMHQVTEMIMQLVVYLALIIWKNIKRR